jgi:predicted nucleic acid-binding protein
MTGVLDTNAVISGIFWSGPPNNILKAWHENKFLFCALAAKAQYIVTGDKALLGLNGYSGIHILKPSAYVKAARI